MTEQLIAHPSAPAAPPAAITRLLAQFDRRQIEGFIEVAIQLLDLADGDPEAEEDDPPEDSEGVLYRCDERGRGYDQAIPLGQHEDDEDDDEDTEHDGREEEAVF